MVSFEITKQKKKIKIINNFNILSISGPLGTQQIDLNNYIYILQQHQKIFIKNNSIAFFF